MKLRPLNRLFFQIQHYQHAPVPVVHVFENAVRYRSRQPLRIIKTITRKRQDNKLWRDLSKIGFAASSEIAMRILLTGCLVLISDHAFNPFSLCQNKAFLQC